MDERERLSRVGFTECLDEVLTGLATTDSRYAAFGWRPSIELNQGVSTIWIGSSICFDPNGPIRH